VEARQQIPGLTRNENDAATALGALVLGMLVMLCTGVLALHFLSGLPSIMVYAIFFSVLVFAVVCGVAFMRSDLSARHAGPPELHFRGTQRRARRRTRRPKPLT
jgi:hypothetical protein